MKKTLLAVAVLMFTIHTHAADTWHTGHIVYKHTFNHTEHKVVPPETRIQLDDGTDVAVSDLAPDDIFQKLVTYWARERTDYRAEPESVDRFMVKARNIDPKTGLRVIQVQMVVNGLYGRRWKGTTHIIK